jgi:hypothetical protein
MGKRTPASVFEFWVDHTITDWVVAVLACVLVVRFDATSMVTVTSHATFYQTMVELSLGLLGLGGIALTLLLTVTPTDRLRIVIDKCGKGLVGIMFGCLLGLVFATLCFAALFALDDSRQERMRAVVFTVAMVLLLLRAGRLYWIFQRVLALLV